MMMEYKGKDGGGRMDPTILTCTISKPEIKKTKDGSGEYISVDLAYKDDKGEWRYIRFNNFNPEKSDRGKQLWKNFLIVAGAKNGHDLEKKVIRVVVIPTPYTKQDGSEGKSYKVFEMGYFSKDGKSAGEIEENKEGEKMMALLGRAVEEYDNQPTPASPASTPETSDDLPFLMRTLLIASLLLLTGCQVRETVDKLPGYFSSGEKVMFYNEITGEYLFTVEVIK